MFSISSLTHALGLPHLAAFLLCFLTLRPLIQIGVMDHPVQRSAHREPTPKGGGLAIIIAFLGGMALDTSLTKHFFSTTELALMGGALFLCIVSWWDDLCPFPAHYKFLAQCTATLIIALSFHPTISMFFPMLIIGLLYTNAINFIDGLNGLASGTMALIAIIMAGFGIAPTILLLLAVGLLVFLPFNIPKARIFMGDAGSQPCALILSWAELSLLTLHQNTIKIDPLFWLFPCLTTGILWDVIFTLIRRFIAKNSLITAHHGHLYQLATRTGFPALYITFCHWFFVIWGGIAFALLPGPLCVGAVLLPQLIWTVLIVQKARTHLKEKW